MRNLLLRILCCTTLISVSVCCQELPDDPIEDDPITITDITLSATSIILTVGEDRELHVTFSSDGVASVPIIWESTDSNVATVENGLIRAIYPGSIYIIARTEDRLFEASCAVEVKPDMEPVDLGLGALWAPMNLGANSPSESGDYFAWGEILPKQNYSWETYKFGSASNQLSKYFHDRKFVLDGEDDAANIIWGDGWRIPTEKELQQLIDNCEWRQEEMNGQAGYRITGPNGHSIFLPFSSAMVQSERYPSNGGWIWSSEKSELAFNPISNPTIVYSNPLCIGVVIRPVKSITLDSVTIDTISISLKVDERKQIPLKIVPSLGTAACLIWKSENDDVAIVSNGVVLGLKAGQTTIHATSPDGNHSVECLVTVHDWDYPEAESVDLGLSVEWASWNLGASSPEELGDYFAWGETNHKSFFSEENYLFYDDGKNLRKYSSNNTTLLEEDDVATQKWSNGWRLPTEEEIKELYNYCTWTRTTQNGVEGITASRNGKSIFFPASLMKKYYYIQGSIYSYISSSSIHYDNSPQPSGLMLRISNDASSSYAFPDDDLDFWAGYNVRPVRYPVSHDPALNLKHVKLVVGEKLDKLVPEKGNGAESVIWSNSNESVVQCEDGLLTAVSKGTATITVTGERGGASASCEVMVGDWTYPTAEAVDLGLSVKWASWNIGATSRGELGDFIFWGTFGHKGPFEKATDYRSHMDDVYWQAGERILHKEDDIASVEWGRGWRLPSVAEYEELFEKCTKEYAYIDNNHGLLLTGPNGNSIFLPVAPGFVYCGWQTEHIYNMGTIHNGMYWTRELGETGTPFSLLFMHNWRAGDEVYDSAIVTNFDYSMGFTVRPVKE